MGQKTHPYGFRLGVIKTWTSKWYEDKHYQQWLHEDIRIKRAVKDYLYNANVASVEIERAANKAKVIVYTARPGMVIGKGGKGIDNTRVWAQNALLLADAGSITQTPAYYVFRHVSQYVAVGAKRVDATGGDAVAFKNPDGSLVAVMYNSGSANNNYVVSIGGKKLQFAMPASGWATVKYGP